MGTIELVFRPAVGGNVDGLQLSLEMPETSYALRDAASPAAPLDIELIRQFISVNCRP